MKIEVVFLFAFCTVVDLASAQRCTKSNQIFSWIELPMKQCDYVAKTQKRYTFLFRPGCYCQDGFYLNTKTQQCVELRDCFPRGKVYDEVTVVANLHVKANVTARKPPPLTSTASPSSGGSVLPPLALFQTQNDLQRERDAENLIIACEDPNAEHIACGCRLTCRRPQDKCVVCTRGCFCRVGYAFLEDERLRNGGRCVPKEQCRLV